MTVNKWIGIGNVGQDPELQHTGSGTAVTTISVACSERRKDASGEYTEHTEWVRVVCWGRTAENVAKFLRKGREVYVEGRLQTRTYTDRDGQERRSTEVVAQQVTFLRGGSGERSQQAPARASFADDGVPF